MIKSSATDSSGHSKPTIVVGIGASAGGVTALRKFFARLGSPEGIAFLFLQHLDESGRHLAHEVLSHLTSLRVVEITTGLALESGVFYHAPPHATVSLKDGVFLVEHADAREEQFSAVDHLFRSLAKDQGQRAVALILSGDGSDGALGLKTIGDAGGLTIAQMPETAEFPSMPQNAIATGAVDHILSPEEMPTELVSYEKYLVRLFDKGEGSSIFREITAALTEICEILHKATRHDFKHYKTSTLVRRILRRMQVLQIESVEAYLDKLRLETKEVDALFKELLINVTSFFRDPEAFETLKTDVLAKALKGRKSEHKFRVWVAGCSTGEEVYTLAILIREILDEVENPPEIQIIATDIDEVALNLARKGSYLVTIAEHVSPERLKRFFVKKGGRYHVTKELREIVLFSSHNLINDPPFSQLDLISCRNVLIYLGPHLQKKLIPVFHYALRAGGCLFLGTSESLAGHKELFRTMSARHRIAQRKATAIRTPGLPSALSHTFASHPSESNRNHEADLHLVGQRIVLDEFAPRYAIVNDDCQVVSVSGGLSMYLEPSEGTFQNNLMRLVKPSLRVGLRSAFTEAKAVKRKITYEDSTLKVEDVTQWVGITVQPMPQLGDESGLFMVIFQYLGRLQVNESGKKSKNVTTTDTVVVEQLERELTTMREDLDRSVQDLEASNEELKSSNEELLSMNEELQSANEELEVSKEEVQNANDTLQKNNNDLENLLASTQIATLFLDDTLAIRSFTPALETIYNVTRGDTYRPISHFTHLAKVMPEFPDPKWVAQKKEIIENDVEMLDGRWVLRRISPYRTPDGHLSGIVVTFIDVTHLRIAEENYRELANSMPNIIWTATPEGHFEYYNERWYKFTGFERTARNKQTWATILHPEDVDKCDEIWKKALQDGTPYQMEFRFKDRTTGGYRWFLGRAVPSFDAFGKPKKWYGSCVDIHDRVLAEESRLESERRFQTMADSAPVLIWVSGADKLCHWFNKSWLTFTGRSMEQELGSGWTEGVHLEDLDRCLKVYRDSFESRSEFYMEYRLRHRSGDYRWVSNNGVPRFTPDGTFDGFIGACMDIHGQKLAAHQVVENERRLDTMFKTSPAFMCVLRGPQFIFERVNPQYQRLIGDRELIGKPVAEALPEVVGQGFIEMLDDVFRTGTPYVGTELALTLKRHADAHPETVYVDFVYQMGDGSRDGDRGIFVHGTDVTEKVMARRIVEQSKFEIETERKNFRNLFKQTPEMVCILSGREHRFEFVNEAHVRALGFDATGRTVRDAQPESVEIHKILDDVYRTGITAELNEIPITLGDRLRHFNLTYAARRDLHGHIDGVMVLGTEISEQIMIRESIRGQKEALELTLQGAPTSQVLSVLTGLIESQTGGATLATAYLLTPGGKTLQEGASTKLPASFTRLLQGLAIGMGEGPFDVLPRSGQSMKTVKISEDPRWAFLREAAAKLGLRSAWMAPILSARGQTLGLFIFYSREGREPSQLEHHLADLVTSTAALLVERRGALNELQKAKDEAEESRSAAEAANIAKSRFLANMSHEIRTPLGAIIGFSELLTSMFPGDEMASNYLGRISRNSKQLGHLIDELLDLSKIEANRLEVERIPVSLQTVIEDAISAVAMQARSKGLEFSVLQPSEIPATVMTDPTRLRQILINLVGNAVKFTDKGQVSVSLKILDDQKEKRLEVRVKDTGIGLKPEQREHIFEPFTQADSSITRKYGGSGLGLALSRELARLLGGDLKLEQTSPGQGSLFVLTIALGLDEDVKKFERLDAQAPKTPLGSVLTGRRILVVDDSPDNRMLVSRYLDPSGATYETAADGFEAIEKIREEKFDVVLMDLQMPRLDGYQAVQQLRAGGLKLPIVALTAHALKEERERCLQIGFDAYVTKPIDQKLLIKVISELVLR